MNARILRALAGLTICCGAVSATRAGSIGLAWNAVPGAAGYRVYYGNASGHYTASKDVGAVTSTSLGGLSDCSDWYVAVKAYNAAGESAAYSEEVRGWPRPSVTAPQPAGAMQGAQISMQVFGANFKPGARFTIDNPRVRLQSAFVIDCNRIDVAATIDPDGPGNRPAQAGNFTLSIDNPEGTFGQRVDGFEVEVNPSRFDVNQSTESTRGRLDGADTVWLARLFSSHDGVDALYDPDFDFDGDGWIDGADLTLLATNFGSCWSGTAWTTQACSAAR